MTATQELAVVMLRSPIHKPLLSVKVVLCGPLYACLMDAVNGLADLRILELQPLVFQGVFLWYSSNGR
jgi:hypothetical protein